MPQAAAPSAAQAAAQAGAPGAAGGVATGAAGGSAPSAATGAATSAATGLLKQSHDLRERAKERYAAQDFRSAVALQSEALERVRDSAGQIQPRRSAALQGILLTVLGRYQSAAGDRDTARESHRAALRILKPWMDRADSGVVADYGLSMLSLAQLLNTPDDREELIAMRADALRVARNEHSSTVTIAGASRVLSHIAAALTLAQRRDEAIEARSEAVAILEGIADHDERARALLALARAALDDLFR